MFTLPSKIRILFQRRHRTLWRSLWVLLLLLHAPATVKVFSMAFGAGSDGSSLSSFLLITATNLFFICEIIFAWSLHLLKDRRSAIAFLAIICLLHVGVINHGFPDFAIEYNLPLWLVFTAGGIAALNFMLPILLPSLLDAISHIMEQRRRIARLFYHLHVEPAAAVRRPDHGWRSAPLRAPPVHTL